MRFTTRSRIGLSLSIALPDNTTLHIELTEMQKPLKRRKNGQPVASPRPAGWQDTLVIGGYPKGTKIQVLQRQSTDKLADREERRARKQDRAIDHQDGQVISSRRHVVPGSATAGTADSTEKG